MFDENAIKLGIAPIGWTNDDLPELGGENTFEQCISEMALAGFTGTEVGNKYPRHIPTLKNALKLRGMEVASAWFSAFITTKPFEDTASAFIAHRDFLHEMGAKVIVVSEQGRSIQGQQSTPVFVAKPVFTAEDWSTLAEGLNRLGKLAQDKGMQIAYHHHMGTGVQTTEEIDKLMELTDENYVSLLYDTGHLYLSGENPLEVLERHFTRIKHVHLKDIRPVIADKMKEERLSFLQGVKEGVFTVPGDGTIDFKPLFQLLAQRGYKGWMVVEAEQDPAVANPFKYALIARKYIKETAGV